RQRCHVLWKCNEQRTALRQCRKNRRNNRRADRGENLGLPQQLTRNRNNNSGSLALKETRRVAARGGRGVATKTGIKAGCSSTGLGRVARLHSSAHGAAGRIFPSRGINGQDLSCNEDSEQNGQIGIGSWPHLMFGSVALFAKRH